MSPRELKGLTRRLKIAALERKLFKIRHDYHLLILLILGARSSPISRASLLKKIDCSEVSFRKYYNELAELGLIEIIQTSTDMRKKTVKLTELGHKQLNEYEKEFNLIVKT